MGKTKRVIYFDLLNILACFGVIAMHCNGMVHAFKPTAAWAQSLIPEVLFYWAVPVFFMISGATLMNYRRKYDTRTFFKRRMLRVLLPFLVFSTLLYLWKAYAIRAMKPVSGVPAVMDLLLNNRMESVYWFFVPMIAVYLSMPLLSWLTRPECRKTLWYTVCAYLVVGSLLPQLCEIARIPYNWSLSLPVCGGYVVFVLLGYLLSTATIGRFQRVYIYIAGLLSALLRYGAVYSLSMTTGKLDDLFFNYMMLPSVALAVAVFVAFRYLPFDRWADRLETHFPARRAVGFVSSCSFGIYLIHKFVMYYEQEWLTVNPEGWKWRVIGPFLTYLVCLAMVGVLKKIPGVRHLIP